MAFSEWVTSKTWAAEDVSVAEANEQWRDRPQSLKDAVDAEPKTNSDGVSHAQGTVVRLTATAGQVARSTSAGQTGPMGVQVSSSAVAASGTGYYRFGGMVYVLCTGAVAVGDTLQTSSTAGTAVVGSTNPFARAHGAQASGTGLVLAEIENDVATSGSLPTHTHADASTGGNTLTAPTIADLTNMPHDHSDADDGGPLVAAAVGLTTNGDLLTRAAGVLARLGIGSTQQRLAVVSGAPAWLPHSTAMTFWAYRDTSVQSVNDNTVTKVNLNAEVFDQGSEFDPVTNFQWTVAENGIYVISGAVTLTGLGDGKPARTMLYVNSAETIRGFQFYSGAAGDVTAPLVGFLKVNATAVIDLRVWHNHGSARDVAIGSNLTYLNVVRVV